MSAPHGPSTSSSRPSKMMLQAIRLLRLTEDGRPFCDEFTTVFATLMSSLPLDTHTVGLFHAKYDFSFTSEEAIANLRELKLQQQNKSVDAAGKSIVSTTITTYQVDARSCNELMQLILKARVIKCATDPGRVKFGPEMLFQPTPKGVTLVDAFSKRNGVSSRNVINLLTSSWAGMKLLQLDRDRLTDDIIVSSDVVNIIFQRFAGSRPNTSSGPTPSIQDSHPSIAATVDPVGVYPSTSNAVAYGSSSTHDTNAPSPAPSIVSLPRELSDSDSSSLSDVYSDSSVGVRLHEVKRFHLREFRYCFSGLAAKFWVMDCTTIVYIQEAQTILNAFLEQGLVVPVESKAIASGKTFLMEKSAYYTLSDLGKRLASWPVSTLSLHERSASPLRNIRTASPARPPSVAGDRKAPRLETILEDPALLLLFREHLAENFCEENLRFYLESEKLLEQFHELEKNKFSNPQKVNVGISEAWMIYHTFLASGSASEVNIDHPLQQRIRERMTREEHDSSHPADKAQLHEMSIKKFTEIVMLLEEVRRQVSRLMAADSVPKFIRTKKYLELERDI